MSELEFQIQGLTKDDRIRFERQRRRPVRGSLFTVGVIVAMSVVSARTGGGSSADAGGSHSVLMHGKEVRADKVLVLVDNSGSMIGTDPTVQLQLNRLMSAGISLAHRITIPGFGISLTDPFAMLGTFDQQVAANPSVDTVYVISDFSNRDDEANTPDGYARLRKTLRDRRLRLYWATVRDDPSPVYYQLARQSGGDVVPAK